MAFPALAGTVASSATGAVNTTSLTVTLPGSIAAGDGILVSVSFDGNGTLTVNAGSSSSGWMKLGQTTQGTTTTSAWFWQPSAAGGGTDALVVTSSVAERGTALATRITGHSTSITPDYAGQSGTSAANAGNGPNLAPAAGAKDYLWFTGLTLDNTTSVATAAPTNYSNLATQAGPASSSSCSWASRQLNAASTDPGTFTHAAAIWVGETVAIHPAGATTTPISVGPIALTLTPSVSRRVNRTQSLSMTLAPAVSRVVDRQQSLALTLSVTVDRIKVLGGASVARARTIILSRFNIYR